MFNSFLIRKKFKLIVVDILEGKLLVNKDKNSFSIVNCILNIIY